MKIEKSEFDYTTDGRKTLKYRIQNDNGAYVELCDYGATVLSILVKDKYDKLVDVALGYKHISGYEEADTYFGGTIGRCCNRIDKGKFSLNNKSYKLNTNNGTNHLHGGNIGFSSQLWNSAIIDNKVVFSLFSPDGQENYPGDMNIKTTYSWDNNNVLRIEYHAICDKDTLCNITNHTYFNLSGHDSGDVLEQCIRIYGDSYLPVNENMIPTGEIKKVNDTSYDFTKYKRIRTGAGIDHNYILESSDKLSRCAEAYSEKTGIKLICATTQKGMQFYTGSYLNVPETKGKNKTAYGKYSGFCLETQNYPDAINHSNFPTVILRRNERYHEVTEYRFEREDDHVYGCCGR